MEQQNYQPDVTSDEKNQKYWGIVLLALAFCLIGLAIYLFAGAFATTGYGLLTLSVLFKSVGA